jgi:hypothetical protein
MFTTPRRCLIAAAAAMVPAALVLTAPAASASPGAPKATVTGLPGPTTLTYTGAEQSYRVPAGVVVRRDRRVRRPEHQQRRARAHPDGLPAGATARRIDRPEQAPGLGRSGHVG